MLGSKDKYFNNHNTTKVDYNSLPDFLKNINPNSTLLILTGTKTSEDG